MSPINYIRRSAAGILVGLVALTMVTAVLGGSLAAIRANATVGSLVSQLTDARRQIDALRDDNSRLAEQNRQILEQNHALVTYLRKHGIAVPHPAAAPPAELVEPAPTLAPDADPKAPTASPPAPSPTRSPSPRPSPPAQAAPTPTPPAPGLEHLCTLAPILCTR